MKKVLALIFSVLFCIAVCSCANTEQPPQENENTTESTESNETTASQTTELTTDTTGEETTIAPPVVDDNSMFVYPTDLRSAVVDYIRTMATTKWTPKETFTLSGKYQSWSYRLTYQKGVTYLGPPFLMNSRGTQIAFNDSLVNGVYVGGTTNADCIGAACYDAVYLALASISPSITFTSTEDMLPKNNTGLIPVGDWNWEASKFDTPTIARANSESTMAKAFAQLQPGDVVMRHIVAQEAGHARIVSEKPVINYYPNGTINPNTSYVTTIEQTNYWYGVSYKHTTWWENEKYTFSTLYNQSYVPLTLKEYTETPEPAYIKGEDITPADKIKTMTELDGKLTSNHLIQKVVIKLTDESGNVVHQVSAYPTAKEVWLSDIDFGYDMKVLAKGNYKFTIDASLHIGTKNIASYSFTVDK